MLYFFARLSLLCKTYLTLCNRSLTLSGNGKGSTDLDARINQSSRSLFLCTTAWVATTAALGFGPKLWWDFDVTLTLVALGLNLIVGIIMLTANFRHLMSMDELQRQTHLEAMAITLGVTFVVTVTYGNLESVGFLEDTQPTNILFVTGVSYIVAVIALWRRRTSE